MYVRLALAFRRRKWEVTIVNDDCQLTIVNANEINCYIPISESLLKINTIFNSTNYKIAVQKQYKLITNCGDFY